MNFAIVIGWHASSHMNNVSLIKSKCATLNYFQQVKSKFRGKQSVFAFVIGWYDSNQINYSEVYNGHCETHK